MTRLPTLVALTATLLLSACPTTPPAGECNPACGASYKCEDGKCVLKQLPGEDAGDIVIGPGADAGGSTGTIADPFDPDNATKDTDCDGLSDQEEFSTVFPGGLKTHPDKPDTDGDGILDGVEMGKTVSVATNCSSFKADQDPTTATSPVNADSDGDGVQDGVEDANHNGKVDTGESDPSNPDTDNDGLKDGLELSSGTAPTLRDTDGDGIPDGAEDLNHDGKVDTGETDPRKADSDGDGCLDGQEDKNWNHRVDSGETDPLKASDCGPALGKDSDCDGLSDADETLRGTNPSKADTDGDGLLDGQEVGVTTNPDTANCKSFVADSDPASRTDPLRMDSDCDGLLDGAEDKSHNGKRDSGESDPNKRDTDGDGLTDGVESGVGTNPDPTNCPAVVLDADSGLSKSDPTDPDADGDGIADGAEDSNQNGRWDTGELNPLDGSDGAGPAKQACAAANMRQVNVIESGNADLAVAVTADFTEYSRPVVGGVEKAVMVYSPAQKVVGIAMLLNPTGANVSADEQAGVAKLRNLGTVSNAVAQTFTTWDKFPGSHDMLDLSGGQDLKTAANSIAQAFLGSPSALLNGNAGVFGPFKVEAEYVRRSAQRTIAVISIMPASAYSGAKPFYLSDVGGGSALAQFGDAHAAQCEVFKTAAVQMIDILWVVDNSGSMEASQNSVANAGQAMIDQLQNSTLDWRIAAVSAGYYSSSYRSGAHRLRTFTKDVATVRSWFQSNGSDWFGISGNPTEGLLGSAREATKALLPATANSTTKLRTGATLVVILLGDSDDQTSDNAATYTSFFSNFDSMGNKAQVHAIACPNGTLCSNEEDTIGNPGKINAVVANLGGVFGDIRSGNTVGGSFTSTIQAILNAAAAGVSPYSTQKPPIASTIKVALDPASLAAGSTCNANDLPRDRTNGFDFDGLTGRILFFGSCRPTVPNKDGAVSYRYWIDLTSNPNGNPDPCGQCTPPFVCDRTQNKCVCPADCGVASPGSSYYCDYDTCAWKCAPDCNGCGTNFVCNTTDPNACKCDCNPSITCGVGFKFDTTTCGCVCNPPALQCGAAFNADAKLCACICKPECGGTCAAGLSCDQSACECRQPPQ
ncbi:MAG: adventurous gliding motility lipoprotein CglD [Myxococcales bacterium]